MPPPLPDNQVKLIQASVLVLRASDSTNQEKSVALGHLSLQRGVSGIIACALSYDPDALSYVLDCADPQHFPTAISSGLVKHIPQADVLWLWAIGVIGYAAIEYHVANMTSSQKEIIWRTIRKRFPRIINAVWTTDPELRRRFLTESDYIDRRTSMFFTMRFIAEGLTDQDIQLKESLFKYHAFEVNLYIWATDCHTEVQLNDHCHNIYNVSTLPNKDPSKTAQTRFHNAVEPSKAGSTLWVCRRLLRCENTNDMQTSYAIGVTCDFAPIARQELYDGNIQEDVILALWRQLKNPPNLESRHLISKGIEFITHLVAQNSLSGDESVMKCLEPLITKHGLIALLGRIMYDLCAIGQMSSTYEYTILEGIMSNIAFNLSKAKRAIVEDYVRPIWISILDSLREFVPPLIPTRSSLPAVWESFGLNIGLNEPAARGQASWKAAKLANGLVGCSWHRCILFKQEPAIKRVMFHDSNKCRQVQYCSALCQEMDWEIGGHQDVCMPAKRPLKK